MMHERTPPDAVDDQAEVARLQQRVAELEQQAAAAQSECTALYQGMFVKNNAVKLLIDPETGAIVDASPSASTFYGYPLDVLRHMNITDINTMDSAAILAELQQAQSEARRYFRFHHRLASGEIRDVEVYSGPVTLQGRPLLFSIIHDITAHNQAVEALRESEERYRTIADWTYDWEYWIDPTGQYRYVSPSCEQITGYRPEAFQSDPTLLERLIHPADQARVTHHLHTEMTAEEAAELEFRIITRSGVERWIGHACRPVYAADGRRLGQRVSNRDITARVQAEETLRQTYAELEQRVASRTAELHDTNQVLRTEIAHHQQTTAALQESQALFQAFLEHSPMLIFARDLEGRYLFVNHEYEAMVGCRQAEIVGKTPYDVLPASVARQFLAQDQDTRTTGTSTIREYTLTLHNRTLVYLKYRFPLYDAQGTMYAVGGISTDITMRKRMEEALYESEARYRRLTENAPDIIYRFRLQPTPGFEYVNPTVTQITGYTPEEHYADPQLGSKLIYPPDQRLLMAVVQGEMPFGTPIELRWMHKNGTILWIEQRNVPIYDAMGMLTAIEGIARDITARKAAEQALVAERTNVEALVIERTRELRQERDRTRAILEALGEAVMVVDMEGMVQYLNPAAVALTGMPNNDPARSRPWLQWQHLASPELVAELRTAIRSGQTWRGEVILKRVDGTCYDAALTVAPLFDPEQPEQPISFVSVQRDITAMKLAERMKDQFVSNVSHELRSPMSLITMLTGSLELLYPRMDDARRLEIIQDIRKHTRVLSDLIGDVLEISRIDSGRIDSEQQPLNLARLAMDEIESLKPMAHKKALTLTLDCADELLVLGQAGQLRQVIRNLLNNALKYTPDGGWITCVCQVLTTPIPRTQAPAAMPGALTWPGNQRLPPGRWAACLISDTGIGINPGDLPHIFERFYRAQTQGDIPGTGLGLSIAWELVRRHAGYLEVSSKRNVGSSFALYLPLKEDQCDT
jgi:PAS domain S-box-containing protein